MQLQEGLTLLSGIDLKAGDYPQHWADLGCGSGFFTGVLAHLLYPGSTITAIDSQQQQLAALMGNSVNIRFIMADFTQQKLPVKMLDGVLMANSFHYVKDKTAVITQIQHCLKADGKVIIIEYDTRKANPWVPYPIDYIHLGQLLTAQGFSRVQKIGERKSLYNQGSMYAAVAQFI